MNDTNEQPIVRKAKYLGSVDFKTLKVGDEFEIYDDNNPVLTQETMSNGVKYQYSYTLDEKPILEPTCYDIVYNKYGEAFAEESSIKTVKFFGSNPLQQDLINRCFKFFEKADIFKQFEETPRTGFLIAGEAGTGKTATINAICLKLLENGDTAVIKFDTRNSINNLVYNLRKKTPAPEVKKIAVVLEDIGGGEGDPKSTAKFSDGALLSFLDGNSYPYDIPIVIFATTNYPENMLANLIDRPGRFDDVIFINAPSNEVKAEYMEFLLKRPITEQEKKYIAKNHSMAHIKKAVVNLLVHGTPIDKMLQEMTKHSEKVKRDELNQENDERMGI